MKPTPTIRSPISSHPSLSILLATVSYPLATLIRTLMTVASGNEDTGKLFEVLPGWAGEVRWQRAGGHGFPVNKPLQPEDIIAKWSIITNFGRPDFSVWHAACFM